MATSLVSDVLARVKPTESRAGWWKKMPPDVLAELEQLRARFHAGELGSMQKTALGRAIVEVATDRGLFVPRLKQVLEWLGNSQTT